MNKTILLLIMTGFTLKANSQIFQTNINIRSYQPSYHKTNELVHTKLDVKFDFEKTWLYGKAWITLKPHFYPVDSVVLDAKGMEIKKVSIEESTSMKDVWYTYDGMQLSIKLDKTYDRDHSYVIYIDYISRPNEFAAKESAAITDSKGLYFINPKGEEKNKPTQIWTQGETESNSVWMPTIDKPNQKSTEEIYMTVPEQYVTLSNGLLISQKKNTDGSRTDYWKMDLPHAPYLFFMGTGDFSIVKDKYKEKEVNYYVEKKYEPFARSIFGNTPEMMKFFSEKLDIDFPWPKYAQIVVRDYISGAMENTTATLHQESANQNARQLTDGNEWETTIAHELFHQWFGNLVTAESWSNTTVSESFANYSEYLWLEHKMGKDAADEHHFNDLQGYFLQPKSDKKSLVRFDYDNSEDMFDVVSYNKGGRILNMLRNYIGDDAFYRSLNNYLTGNKFKTGEAHQLRLSFEEITGEDLNWFWNQWYYGNGHPKLKIDYLYNDVTGKVKVIIQQVQDGDRLFRLPVKVDVYNGAVKQQHTIWIENRIDTFTFPYSKHPDLVNVDADKILLCEKTDNKSVENFIHQFKYAPNYLDRREAIEFFFSKKKPELILGLQDKYPGLRRLTIEHLTKSSLAKEAAVIDAVEKLTSTETNKKTLAAAVLFLARTRDSKYETMYNKLLNDSSYTVAGAALAGIEKTAPSKAYDLAKKCSTDAEGSLEEVIMRLFIANGSESDFDFIAGHFTEEPFSDTKLLSVAPFALYLGKIKDPEKIKNGIDYIIQFRNAIPNQYRGYTESIFKAILDQLGKTKGKEITAYIKTVFK